MDWQAILDRVVTWAASTGIRLIVALILLFVSFKLINFIGRRFKKGGEKRNVDKTLLTTGIYVGTIALKVVVVVCLVGYVGIDTSSITALIASFGVCIGLAVNGALANIAGGVLLLVTRPFKVDDYIEAQGTSGTVAAINLTNTKLITPDNKAVHVPNGALANGNIINYSEKDTRRVDIDFPVALGTDVEKAKAVVLSIASAHSLVLKDKDVFVRQGVGQNGEMLVKCRVWTKNGDYWAVYFDLLEAVKAQLSKEGIMPFAQRVDININK